MIRQSSWRTTNGYESIHRSIRLSRREINVYWRPIASELNGEDESSQTFIQKNVVSHLHHRGSAQFGVCWRARVSKADAECRPIRRMIDFCSMLNQWSASRRGSCCCCCSRDLSRVCTHQTQCQLPPIVYSIGCSCPSPSVYFELFIHFLFQYRQQ